MPFRRRRNKSQNFLNYAKGAGAVAGAAFTALKVATGLAALINTEFKFIDHEIAAAAVALPANTTFIHALTANAQGTDEQLRIGNSILPKSLSVRLQFQGNTSGGTDQEIRYMILIDKDNDGVFPTIAQIIQLTAQQDSYMNMDNKRRFRVLVDGSLIVGNGGATANMRRTAKRTHYFKFNKAQRVSGHMHRRKKWYHILYSASSAAPGSLDNGNIFLVAWSNETTNSPTIRSTSRLRFIDN